MGVRDNGRRKTSNDAVLFVREVGRRMREVRVHRGLTREQMGKRLGVSPQQIFKYETGKDAVPLHRLLQFASLFGVSPELFWNPRDIDHANASEASDMSVITLVRAYKQIKSTNTRRRLLDLVRQMACDRENDPA
jgi:transcriptional regulator with XRE-family HTH domain